MMEELECVVVTPLMTSVFTITVGISNRKEDHFPNETTHKKVRNITVCHILSGFKLNLIIQSSLPSVLVKARMILETSFR